LQPEFDQLKKLLERKCSSGPVYFYPNQGNWGDALIGEATRRFFHDIGLEVRIITKPREAKWRLDPRRGHLIYGGGGAWCKLWGAQTRFLESAAKRFESVVVLPSTYESAFPISNGTFLARDRFQSLCAVPEAVFCHDMSFYLGQIDSRPGFGEGNFFREDGESRDLSRIPANNVDLSAQGNGHSAIEPFFKALAKYEVIHTDRLHVAIAACLLGRSVRLREGSYFKNEAVFHSSIEGRFSNASFISD